MCIRDRSTNAQTERLSGLGVKVFSDHNESYLMPADVVVYSSAIPKTNVEYMAARKNGVPIIERAEALAEIMRLKRGIAIGGTHGKTTTTSMMGSVFIAAEKTFTPKPDKRSVWAFVDKSLPFTSAPILCRSSARPLIPMPPIPIK